MGTIRYVLRTDKTDKNGQHPVEMIYQVQGQRKYFRTKIKLFTASWDEADKRAVFVNSRAAKGAFKGIRPHLIPTEKEVQAFNRSLDNLSRQVKDIEMRYSLDGEPYTAEMVVERLKGIVKPDSKRAEPSNLVYDYIDNYISAHAAIREKGSLSVYKALRTHLQNFQKETGTKVSFANIDTAFFLKFQTFLVTTEDLTNTTAAKQLSTLKTFLSYAKKEGIKVSESYRDFRIKRDKLEVIALTEEEFKALYEHDFTTKRSLDQVRDVFCFSCATGLRYSDLSQLRREHITADEIRITVKKTKSLLRIPLNPYSAAILHKYRHNHLPLPVISNVNFNKYIKIACAKAKIKEPIEIVRFKGKKRIAKTFPKCELVTVHTGRKTFCTLSLYKGMTAEEVMRISGHLSYASFQRYVNITEQRKKESMARAWGSPEDMSMSKLKAV